MALERWRESGVKQCNGSLIDQISIGDMVRKDIFKRVGFYKDILIISQDFNFDSTIRRGIKGNAIKSLILLIDYIFNEANSSIYNDILMLDLPMILAHANKLNINQFFSRSLSESMFPKKIHDLCSMETIFKDNELPVFSDKPTEYKEISHFRNPHNIQEDLIQFINDRHFNKGTE